MTATSHAHPRLRHADLVRPVSGTRPSLLDVDPDLGSLLDRERREAARRQLTLRLAVIETGEWDVAPLRNADPAHVGLLVVDGVLAREIVLEDTVSTELLAPGDLARPWQSDSASDLLPASIRWNALCEVRVAILDRQFAAKVAQWPEVNAMLFERVHARAQRLAMTQAISQLNRVDRRLVALFRHLAERFGRVTPDGVVVPLALSHRLLGELVGARRPTVSTALAALAAGHELLRLQDGTWLLPGRPGDAEAPGRLEVIRQRRRLIPSLIGYEERRGGGMDGRGAVV